MATENEIWDEFRWEAFLAENDNRIRRYLDMLLGFVVNNPPPESDQPDALGTWQSDLKQFMVWGGWSSLESDEAAGRNDLLALFQSGTFENAPHAEDIGGVDSDGCNVTGLTFYRESCRLTVDVLEWADGIPLHQKEGTLVQFCDLIMQIPANLAKGSAIGFERDVIGGNIACAKRALSAGNKALSALHELRAAPFMPPSLYASLYERIFDIRNETGLYVQELRARFELGVD